MSFYPETLITCIRENRMPTFQELDCLAEHIWSDLGFSSSLPEISGPHCETMLRLARCALQGTAAQCREHERVLVFDAQPAELSPMAQAA